jgi:uncharacterized protein
MKTVTLEEHFFTESYLRAAKDDPSVQFGGLQPKLLDLGAGRIAAMDEAGIDVQVLSLAAFALEGLDAATGTALARDVNDELAAAVKANPTRWLGLRLWRSRIQRQRWWSWSDLFRSLGLLG